MKYKIFLFLVGGLYPAVRAQQPRLPQVDRYRAATGREIQLPAPEEIRYHLLGTLYDKDVRLMLNLPDFHDKGTKEAMPFGYRLKTESEVELKSVAGNLSESTVRKFYNRSVFTGISYLFCDSTVYGIRLYYCPEDKPVREFIGGELDRFFKKADYCSDSLAVYSDPDYLVKIGREKVEIYSLFHYPAAEVRFPGVTHFYWEAPCMWPVGETAVSLSFYNQRTKENNWQTAFRLKVTGREKKFGIKEIRFKTDDTEYSYSLESDFYTVTDKGYGEADMRTFVFPEEAKEILRSRSVTVSIVGENDSISYPMPMFQRVSLFTAFEYFRWHVTQAMEKYKNW